MWNHCFCWVFKTQIIRRWANMHTVCMHVQFKNIKRSVPALERIEPFSFAVATSSGNQSRLIINNANYRWLTRTNCRSQQRSQGIYNVNANVMRILARKNTVNPLLNPRGAYFFSSTFEEEPNREGGLKEEGGGGLIWFSETHHL